MKGEKFLYTAFFIALIASLGSLFFSEVMSLPPCVLCWYQRICMYPLVVILYVGLTKKDKHIFSYAFPLSVIGWLVALYQNLLILKVLPEKIAPCTNGVSCTTNQIEFFGFITIPLLSLVAFSLINGCLLIWYQNYRSK